MEKQLIKEAVQFLKSKQIEKPVIGIILGTGLNSLVEKISDPVCIPYDDIPNFPSATVSFHKGQLVFGKIKNVPVVLMQGRFHYYENYTMKQITFPVRVMKELGISLLLLSNAAGGLNTDYKKGDLVIIEDHINMMPDNPLRDSSDELGNRFVDMSQPYELKLQEMLCRALKTHKIPIKKGIYVAVMGPSLETRAEYRWLRNTGADMVGMSTVPEVIVANQEGIKCGAISVITDECDPDNLKPVNIEEIIKVAHEADKKLSVVFEELIGFLK
ncbi:MAG: purine-nucleoside phosphorylase [Ferruginibacter sp.]